jgi:hypothetical protein
MRFGKWGLKPLADFFDFVFPNPDLKVRATHEIVTYIQTLNSPALQGGDLKKPGPNNLAGFQPL